MEFKEIIDKMKERGIETALVKYDGGLVYSTFAMEDPAHYVAQYLASNAQLLMSQFNDRVKEIKIEFKEKSLIFILLEDYLLVSQIKNDEDKKILYDYINL
ncbi:MAG: hypothetical protein AB1391_01810 [Candidatus Micrarchaeota archaeon]